MKTANLQRLIADLEDYKDLMARTGISSGSISNYRNGRVPKAEELVKLARYFQVSLEYLLGLPNTLEPAFRETARTTALKAELPQPLKNEGGPYYGTRKAAPIIALASAGELHTWEDQGLDVPHIPTHCQDPNCYAVEITGVSMEPVYHEGDIAVVAPNREAQNGDLVIAKTINEEPLFKKLKFSPDLKTIRLFSFNQEFPVMDLKRSEVRFLHPVFAIVRCLKERP